MENLTSKLCMMKSWQWRKMQSLISDHLSGKTINQFRAGLEFSNVSIFFSSGSDPSQHILDTLEQCISVIIEKIQRLDQERNGSRMSSIDYNKANEGTTLIFFENSGLILMLVLQDFQAIVLL